MTCFGVAAFSHSVDFKFQFVYSSKYEGWNFNSGNYLFTTDTK